MRAGVAVSITAFRGPQAALALRSLVVGLAPHMQSLESLRRALFELSQDTSLWMQLELEREPLPAVTRRPTMPEVAR